MNPERFDNAPTFPEYLGTVRKNRDLWHALYDRVRLPEDVTAAARGVPGPLKLLALTEDWCGDAVNTLPVVARLAEEVGWDMRLLGRDENDDLMRSHLTDGRSRSIPVVIVYDADFEEVGWWGPRPRELQRWVLEKGLALESGERYRIVRRWYARDGGRTALRELVDLIVQPA